MRLLVTNLLTSALLAAVLPTNAQQLPEQDAERGERGITLTPNIPDTDAAETTSGQSEPVDAMLPALAGPLPGDDAGVPDRLHIQGVVLEGNTVLPDAAVRELLADFEDRTVSIDDIHALRYRLTELYVNSGYVSSGVTLPDQRIDDGTIRLQAVEGRLSRITIARNRTIRDSYLEERIRRGVHTPVNAHELQAALNELRFDPRIARINARLLPGAMEGESTLQVDVIEKVNYWVTTSFDNYRSPSVDENRVSLSAGNNNFTGNGDVFAFNVRVTDGLDDLDVFYSFPLTVNDLRVSTYYGSTDSAIVEKPFDIVDIESESETAGISLSRPFRNASGRSLTMTLGLENREAQNWLLGMPFSFTPGEQDGQSEVGVAYLMAQMLWPSPRQIIGLSLSGRVGVDLFDATTNDSGPDSRFSVLRAQFEYARNLDWRSSRFIVRSSAQIASRSLLALEKFSVGGHTTVRGYRENQLVRDNGLVASAELQFPLFVDDDGNATQDVQIAPFLDFGVAWDSGSGSPTTGKMSLASAGLGLHWRPGSNWLIRVDYGYSFKDFATPTKSLQDRGLQFRLEYRITPTSRY